MEIKGVPFVLLAVPFVVGLWVCVVGGIYVMATAVEWLLERIARRCGVIREFAVFTHRRTTDRAARPPVALDDCRVTLETLLEALEARLEVRLGYLPPRYAEAVRAARDLLGRSRP